MWIGGVTLAYYWVFFDVGVPTGYGRVVNFGLMQDRLIGTMVGMLILGLGAFLKYGAGPVEGPPVAIPPPLAPMKLPCDIKAATMYAIQQKPNAAISRPVWRKTLEQHASLSAYTDSQLEWGYSWNVPPAEFPRMVAFIESYKSWERAQPKGIA
jgi:hypothetical protein